MKHRSTTYALLLLTMLFNTPVLAASWPNSTFSNLDYGLYWFGTGDNYQKASPGSTNPYYNKNKKTIIYIHGWLKDSSVNKARVSFDVSSLGGPEKNIAEDWINAGYNVGILYWNQFSDEDEVKDAEAKIWTTQGPKAMRWKRLDGSYADAPTDNNVTQLLYNNLIANIADFQGPELRIAGHSLGNQLALTISDALLSDVQNNKLSPKLLPQRIALLDYFYSNGGKAYLGNAWVGEESRDIASRLINNDTAIEAYRTSVSTSSLLAGDANNALIDIVAFTEIKPWYFAPWDIGKKHTAARWYYFWSFSFDSPIIKGTNDDGATASTSTRRIKELMQSTQKLVQRGGVWTKTPGDDQFTYKKK